MVGAAGFVSGRVLVDGLGKVILAQVDKKRHVRSVGHDELQLAARHVVHTLVYQSPQPVALALLVSQSQLATYRVYQLLWMSSLFRELSSD